MTKITTARIRLCVVLGSFLGAVANADRASAGLVFYNELSTFTGANGVLPTETFESANVAPGGFVANLAGPINSQTSDGVFAAGALQPGFSLSSVGSGATTFVAVGTGTTPGGTKAVGVGSFSNALEIDFTSPVAAAGANLYLSTGPGAAVSGSLLVQVFGASGLLGSETVNVSGVNSFVGVSSTGTAITKIDVSQAAQNSSIFVDNLTFGGSTNNYSSRAAFLAANPGLSTETFESANVIPGGFVANISGPINSNTANAAFAAGSLLPGFSVNSLGTAPPTFVVTGTGTVPGGTKEVGVQFFSNTLAITFTALQAAVGLDLIASTGPGATTSAVFDINVYGANGLIETEMVNVSGVTTFFGVSSMVGITEIDISEVGSNASVFIDNLTFTPTAVPEPSTLVLSGLGLATLLGYQRFRRPARSTAPRG